jgi:hypothetical protein
MKVEELFRQKVSAYAARESVTWIVDKAFFEITANQLVKKYMEPYALNSTIFMAGKVTEFKYLQHEVDGLFPEADRVDDHTEAKAPNVDKAIYPTGYVKI